MNYTNSEEQIVTTSKMVKLGPRVAPANMFTLHYDEVYAGTPSSEWEVVVNHLELLKLVRLEDIEPENQECDICRESFRSSDNGTSSEKPVSLPCRHIFGKNCILDWIAVSRRRDFNRPIPVGNSSVGLLTAFSCPKCRKTFTIEISGELTAAIEARLRLWDLAYQKLGIIRSVEEEEDRQDLWRFVEELKLMEVSWNGPRSLLDLRAQVSGLRFALQQLRWDLTPVQLHLRDAFFNLACYGVNDVPEEYCAESYEDRTIPTWCQRFARTMRGHNPNLSQNLCEFFDNWEQQRIGPWRRSLFEITEDIASLEEVLSLSVTTNFPVSNRRSRTMFALSALY